MKTFAFLLAGTAALGMAGSASAVTFISGVVDQNVVAGLAAKNKFPTNVDAHTSHGKVMADRTATTTATAHASLDGDVLDLTSTATAKWNNANSGTVTVVHDLDMTLGATNAEEGFYGFNDDSRPRQPAVLDWTYTFATTANGAFNLDLLDETGPKKFRPDWALFIFQDGKQVFSRDLINIDEPFKLKAGHQYTVKLDGLQGEIRNFNPNPAGLSFETNSTFGWSITGQAARTGTGGIPEPTTWAMAILGFGLSGAMLRRRRQVMAEG